MELEQTILYLTFYTVLPHAISSLLATAREDLKNRFSLLDDEGYGLRQSDMCLTQLVWEANSINLVSIDGGDSLYLLVHEEDERRDAIYMLSGSDTNCIVDYALGTLFPISVSKSLYDIATTLHMEELQATIGWEDDGSGHKLYGELMIERTIDSTTVPQHTIADMSNYVAEASNSNRMREFAAVFESNAFRSENVEDLDGFLIG